MKVNRHSTTSSRIFQGAKTARIRLSNQYSCFATFDEHPSEDRIQVAMRLYRLGYHIRILNPGSKIPLSSGNATGPKVIDFCEPGHDAELKDYLNRGCNYGLISSSPFTVVDYDLSPKFKYKSKTYSLNEARDVVDNDGNRIFSEAKIARELERCSEVENLFKADFKAYPDGYWVRTKNGWHLYCRAGQWIGIGGNGKGGHSKIDIITGKLYVVGPGSVLNCGAVYTAHKPLCEPEYLGDVPECVLSAMEIRPEVQVEKTIPLSDICDETVINRAKSCIASIPDSISGNNGHQALINVVRTAWYDFALEESIARSLVDEYNQNRTGGDLWSKKEIDHKFDDVKKANYEKERGWSVNIIVHEPQHAQSSGITDSNQGIAPFPIDSLPETLRIYCQEIAIEKQTNISVIATTLLGGLSGAIAATRAVEVKSNRRWIEPLILWTMGILPSGSKKSAIISDIKSYFSKAKKEESQRYSRAESKYYIDKREWEDRVKSGNHLNGPGEMPKKPFEMMYTISDATTEGIIEQLSKQDRGAAFIRDEGYGFFGSFNKYSGGDSDVAFYAEAYMCGTYEKLRTGSKLTKVDHTALPIILMIQNDMLGKLFKKQDLIDSGLLQRFCMTMPQIEIKGGLSMNDVPLEIVDKIQNIFDAFLSFKMSDDDERYLRLSQEGFEVLHQHDFIITDLKRYSDEPDTSLYGKFNGKAIRIAGILHLVNVVEGNITSDPQVIPKDTMEHGIKLATWFTNESLRIYSHYSASKNQEEKAMVQAIIDNIHELDKPEGVRLREIYSKKNMRQWRYKNEKIQEIFNRLIDEGKVIMVQEGKGNRKPSYRLNIQTQSTDPL